MGKKENNDLNNYRLYINKINWCIIQEGFGHDNDINESTVTDNCYYTDRYIGAVNNIRNLKKKRLETLLEIFIMEQIWFWIYYKRVRTSV